MSLTTTTTTQTTTDGSIEVQDVENTNVTEDTTCEEHLSKQTELLAIIAHNSAETLKVQLSNYNKSQEILYEQQLNTNLLLEYVKIYNPSLTIDRS
jgi:hypothetical protein